MEIPTDLPIASDKEDLLGRAPLAKEVAKMLLNYKNIESFTVGIEGEWGSGKTSFIDLILEALNKTKGKNKPEVIKFNPWHFENIDALYVDFFRQIGEKIGEPRTLLRFAKRLTRSIDSVELGPEILGNALGKVAFNLGATPESLRSDIEKKLLAHKKKIIIIIDDIDRLDKKDTREVFKLVKVVANFPNIIYMASYDRQKVEKILTEDGFPGAEYLKKIIQVGFALPRPSQTQINSVLGSEIDKTLKSPESKKQIEEYWNNKLWGNLLFGGFGSLFKTIRDIKRFIATWRLDYLIVGYENVNPVDFLGVEAIRVFAPDVYSKISESKDLFTSTENYYLSSNHSKKDEMKTEYEAIINQSSVETKNQINGICRQLFPQIKGLFSNTSYRSTWQLDWEKDLRVCSASMFDIYFSLSVPTGSISQIEFKRILGEVNDSKTLENSLKNIENPQKLRAFLDKLLSNLKKLDKDQKSNLILSMFNFGDVVENELGTWGFDDTGTKVMRICYQSLKQIEDEDERLNILTNAFNKSTSVYAPTNFVGVLVDELEKVKGDSNKDVLIKGDMHLTAFKRLIVQKIKKYLTENKQKLSSKRLASLLVWWKRWSDDKKEVDLYINNLLKSKKGLLLILEAFKITSLSPSTEDLVPVEKYHIDTHTLDGLTGLVNIDRVVKKYFKGSNKDAKRLIELYEESKKIEKLTSS